MLKFIFRKMLNKKWMILGLFLGNLLMVTVAAGNPMYAQAVLQKLLLRDFSASMEKTEEYPGRIFMCVTSNIKHETDRLDRFYLLEEKVQELPQRLQTPAKEVVNSVSVPDVKLIPEVPLEGRDKIEMSMGFSSDLEEHIQLKAGKMFSQTPQDGVLEVMVSQATFEEEKLMLGENLQTDALTFKDGSPCTLQVVGVFEAKDETDPYWSAYRDDMLLIPESLFREEFLDLEAPRFSYEESYVTLLDYTQMGAEHISSICDEMQRLERELSEMGQTRYTENFLSVLKAYLPKSQQLNVTLWALQTPVFVLLAAFIFMVSRQMLSMEENEIAVFKSRGAGRGQILKLYLLQSLLLAAGAFLLGIPMGLLTCQLLGASNSFLEFVQRSALPVKITGQSLLFAAGAALLSVLAMTIPAFRYSKVGIVAHKQRKQSRWKAPLWQKLFLDVILIGVSLYGLFSFQQQKDELTQRVLQGASLDPLLYFSSSLFMLGFGLLALRLFPWLVRGIFTLGKKRWSPAMYASFRRILGTVNEQGFMMIFLILTISMGVFSAQAARTINSSAEEQIYYEMGADIVLKEKWAQEMQSTQQSRPVYVEADFNKFSDIPGVESAARVLKATDGKVKVSDGTVSSVTLLGIHTKEFGETAWMKSGVLPQHWYNYLNALAQNSRGILVSTDFQTEHGYQIGDVLTYTSSSGDLLEGVICGFVDYWPSYLPQETKQDAFGNVTQTRNHLVVANLQQVQSQWGIQPYEVWLRVEGSTLPVYEYLGEHPMNLLNFEDVNEKLTDLKNDPMLQGTNGILTVGFVIVLLLCTVGFLIYWVLSIQSRVLQFGIFRAMGMSLREVLQMLGNEQLFISGVSIAAGAGIGAAASHLFVPLIQMAYASSDQSLPLEIVQQASDAVRLTVVIGGMIVLCMVVLGMLISRIRIAQALKLGED